MSTAQILEEIKYYPTPELESLEQGIRLERLRRHRNTLNGGETRLFEIINEPLTGGSELHELRAKREDDSLTEGEIERLIALENEREIVWARKLRAVAELADLRGQDFHALYEQLGLTLRSEG